MNNESLCYILVTARKRSLGQGIVFTGVSVHRGGVHGRGAAWSGGGAWSLGGWCMVPGVPGGDPPATAAGGTHPTGMHSCNYFSVHF